MPYISTDSARLAVKSQGSINNVKWFYSQPFAIRPDPRYPDAPPTVSVTAPQAGQSFPAGGIVPISWTASDDEALRSFSILYSTDGGRTWLTLVENLLPTATDYNWITPPGTGFNDVRVRVVAIDRRFQNSSDGHTRSFRTDQSPTPTPTPMPGGIEADVAVRPNGDGAIQSDDVVQIRRFLNGTNTPDPATNEFQRADSFPFAEKGDGVLNSADVVQLRRYQNGTSPLQTAGGLTLPNGAQALTDEFNKTEAQSKSPKGNLRGVRVESISTSAGQMVTVNILVDAAGDESEYGFILDYDSGILSNPVIGAGNAGASIRSCNKAVAGQVTCSVGGFAGNNPNSADSGIGEIGAKTNQVLMTVTFTVAANAAGDTPLTLSNVNASSDAPQLFTPTAVNGTVTRFSVRQRNRMR